MKAAAFTLLVATFFASRALLLLTSSATNQNWEEPVFLFSSLELQREGVHRVWDYQDDLDHGGSVPLLLLGTLWLRWWEPSVLALKWLELMWWTAAFVCFLWAMVSLFSLRAAVVGGFLWIGASPNLARLQVTLVGSHPESVLPALCATALLARQSGKGRTTGFSCFVVGWLATVAAWMSYATALWSVAILACLLTQFFRLRCLGAAMAGVGIGVLPWLYQNIYRRPYGWFAWTERLSLPETISGNVQPPNAWGSLSYVADAWGAGDTGVWLTIAFVLLALVLAVALGSSRPAPPPVRAPRVIWSLFAAALLSAMALTFSRIVPLPNEGYYFARFFAPLQVLLFTLAAGGVDVLAQAGGRWLAVVANVVAAALGVYQLVPLYGHGVAETNFRQEWLRGCLVFGAAEFTRASSPERAYERLERLGDPDCRERAFHGLGWSLADEYRRRGLTPQIERVLGHASDPKVRRAICGGLHFVLTRAPGAEQPRAFPAELKPLCPP
ncbi:hypothetical protein HRbin30_01850 [bacterium HR30]|nr:hypothetical protein HRbin30_01850 [bacterium HR30]